MSTEERLEKLELELANAKRRNRWLLAAVSAAMAMGLAWAVIRETGQGQGAKAAEVIRANEFIVEDENGKTRVWLAVHEDAPGLALFDEYGRNRATLAVDENGPQLNLYDEKGKTRAGLHLVMNGPMLHLCDQNGEPRAGLSVLNDTPFVNLYDEKGKTRAMLGAGQIRTPDGKTITYPESSVQLFGPDGKLIWQAPQ